MINDSLTHVNDSWNRYLARSREYSKELGRPLAILLKSWENFYTRRIYHRVQVRNGDSCFDMLNHI